MRHAMIDLETLGTGVDCVVLSCGVAFFDERGTLPGGWYTLLDLDEQLRKRRVDAGTLRWWMEQEKVAQDAAFKGNNDTVLSIADFHRNLTRELNGAERVWSHGLNFDVCILDHMFSREGLRSPWKYNAVRDTRTMYDLVPWDDLPKREGVYHNALHDAKHQAACIVTVMKRLAGATLASAE